MVRHEGRVWQDLLSVLGGEDAESSAYSEAWLSLTVPQNEVAH